MIQITKKRSGPYPELFNSCLEAIIKTYSAFWTSNIQFSYWYPSAAYKKN